MRDLLLLAIYLLVTLTKFLDPGGAHQVVAESLLLKHQLLISNRSRQRAPNFTMLDRLVLGAMITIEGWRPWNQSAAVIIKQESARDEIGALLRAASRNVVENRKIS